MQGKDRFEAALQAARTRLRPILMTSLAFILGVLPLALSSGAGAGAQNAIGIAVIGGVVAGTVLGVLFYVWSPVCDPFYVAPYLYTSVSSRSSCSVVGHAPTDPEYAGSVATWVKTATIREISWPLVVNLSLRPHLRYSRYVDHVRERSPILASLYGAELLLNDCEGQAC
jgi:hypothetical protein